jgi:hypothetical protein
MKKRSYAMGLFALMALTPFLLCSCGWLLGYQEWSKGQLKEGGLRYGYYGSTKKANAESFEWDLDDANRSIVIPGTLSSGYRVTDIGAYRTDGSQSWNYTFYVFITPKDPALKVEDVGPYGGKIPSIIKSELGIKDIQFIHVVFNLSIPAGVKNIERLGETFQWSVHPADNSWAKVYTPEFYCTVDEANETYRSENGIVYKKSDGSKVKGYYAEPAPSSFPLK